MRRGLLLLLLLSLVPFAGALRAQSTPTPVRTQRTRRHKKPRQPKWWEYRVFLPSHENLLLQNAAADALGLERIKDDKALKVLEADADLVPITSNKYVCVSPKLEAKRRYCRPWVDTFLQELGQAYYVEFEEPIQVNSAVRTQKTQIKLLHINRNAAPAHGDVASVHLTGMAVDLQRRGLTRKQIRFIQQKLLYLSNLGMVIVEEELSNGSCFHVVVTGEYPYPPKIKNIPMPFPVGITVTPAVAATVNRSQVHTTVRPRIAAPVASFCSTIH